MSGRIRTIKPEILEDDRTSQLSHEAFRLFIGVILLADDYGNLRGNVGFLDGAVFHSSTPGAARASLDELVESGLVHPYEVKGSRYLHIAGWEKHQRVDRRGRPRCPQVSEADSSEVLGTSETLATDSREARETPATDLRPPTSDLRSGPPTSDPDLRPTTPRSVTPADAGSGDALLLEAAEPEARPSTSAAVDRVVEHYRAKHPQARPGKKERDKVRARLAEGYTAEDLKRAIDGNSASPFHRGENDRRIRYHKLELIMRDSDHVAQFLHLADEHCDARGLPLARAAPSARTSRPGDPGNIDAIGTWLDRQEAR